MQYHRGPWLLLSFQEWSVGKAVDFIAQKYNLRNDNNLVNSKVQWRDQLLDSCY